MKKPLIQKCKWEEDFEGNWETECGSMFCFNEGGPLDNKFNFCPYCSGLMKEIKYSKPKGGLK